MNNVEMKSVNETTVKLGPQKALNYIGSALPRLIHAMATANENYPILFTKADIEDGFWRIFTDEEGGWNFSYVLPSTKEHPEKHIVVPNSIQMGWVESMTIFCASSETARDSIERLWKQPHLPKHKLEDIMMPSSLPPLESNEKIDAFLEVIESYVDDFCALA